MQTRLHASGATGQMFVPLSEEQNSGESSLGRPKGCKLLTSLGINQVILRGLWEAQVETFTVPNSTAFVHFGLLTSPKRQCCGPA